MAIPRNDAISLKTLELSFRQKKFSPVYLFYGEEDFLIDETVDLLVKEAVDEPSKSFNLDIYYGSDVDVKDIVSIASSYPMMGERRVVMVRDFDKLLKKEQLLLIIEKPLPSTCLVLISDRTDFRQNLYKMIKEKGTVHEFRRLYDSEIPTWIADKIITLGKKISLDACQMMLGYVGLSLREIVNEIDKLLIYVGEKKFIDVEDVGNVVGMSKEFNIFELQKAVGQKNIKSSIEILEHLMDAGKSPVWMITMLTKYLQKVWLLQELKLKSRNEAEISRALGVPQYFLKEYYEAAERYTSEQLENCFLSLLVVDETLKSTMSDPKLVMTVLLFKIIKNNSIGI